MISKKTLDSADLRDLGFAIDDALGEVAVPISIASAVSITLTPLPKPTSNSTIVSKPTGMA